MSSEWQKSLIMPLFSGTVANDRAWFRLDQIAEVIDCPHSTPDLVDDVKAPFVVRSQDMRSGVFMIEQAGHVSVETYNGRIERAEPQYGDLLYSREGTYFGIAAEVPRGVRVCLGQRMVLIRPNEETIDHKFLRYWLNSPQVFGHIHGFRDGTVAERLNLPTIRGLAVAVPSLKEQQFIGSILGTLDDRIALLRETNVTLEAIAQTLFKSWFVDFDPIHAKARGEAPEGMSQAVADLFPDSFEESALGMVPKGWRVCSIYDVAIVIYGAPFASKRFNTDGIGIPLIRIRDLKNESPGVYTDEVHTKGYMTQPGDIVVGMDGEFRAYLWGGEPAWLNQRVCVFKPEQGVASAFVHFAIIPLLAAVEASETATTVIHLGKNDIDRFRIVVPTNSILTAFSEATVPVYARIVANKQQSQTLATLRDTLLPRLISGQLRLPEAEQAIAEAVT